MRYVGGALTIWGNQLHEIIGENANFALQFPFPPALIWQVFAQDCDDVALLQIQFVFVGWHVREDHFALLAHYIKHEKRNEMESKSSCRSEITWFWWQTWCFLLANGYCACRTNQILSRTVQTGSASCRAHSIIGCADVVAAPTIGQYRGRTADRRHEIRWEYTDFACQFSPPPPFFHFAQEFNDVTDGQGELIIVVLRVTVNCFESAILRFGFIAANKNRESKRL